MADCAGLEILPTTSLYPPSVTETAYISAAYGESVLVDFVGENARKGPLGDSKGYGKG